MWILLSKNDTKVVLDEKGNDRCMTNVVFRDIETAQLILCLTSGVIPVPVRSSPLT